MSRRIPALDGLRGLAACVVVVHHIFLTVPSFAIAYQFTDPRRAHRWTDALVFSPLHLIWDGPTAVYVFFVLSGFVLAAPYAAGKTGGWRSYYPQRLLRLYLPVWAALVFALITTVIVHRHVHPGASYFVNLHASTPHGVRQALRNATLVFKTGWLDSPLWSLRFEVVFSLLLPVALLAGQLWRPRWPAKLAACLVVITVGGFMHSLVITDTPMFALGTILAYEREPIAAIAARLSPRQWRWLAGAVLLMLTAFWDLWGLHLSKVAAIGTGLSALGACLLVVMMCDWRAASRVGESGLVQWLGKRSFSLYLVHEPIVVATAFALGGRPNIFAELAIAVPLSLLAAEAFFRAVEAPSHQFSRAVGRRIGTAAARGPSVEGRPLSRSV